MAFATVNIDGKDTFLAQLVWNDDICNLTLLDYQGLKTWKAQVGQEENRKMASDLQLNLAEYKAEAAKALSSSSTLYQHTFSGDELIIKKVTSEGLAYRIAIFKIQEVPVELALPGIFCHLTKSLTQLSHDLERKDKEIEQIKKERTMLKERCEKYAKQVETLTPQLYAQFSVAFNSLKARVNTVAGDVAPETTDLAEIADTSLPSRASNSRSSESGGSYDEETDIDTEDEAKVLNSRNSRKRLRTSEK